MADDAGTIKYLSGGGIGANGNMVLLPLGETANKRHNLNEDNGNCTGSLTLTTRRKHDLGS